MIVDFRRACEHRPVTARPTDPSAPAGRDQARLSDTAILALGPSERLALGPDGAISEPGTSRLSDPGLTQNTGPTALLAADSDSDVPAPIHTGPITKPAPSTLVIEDGVVLKRIRRPLDLARFVTALLAIAGIVLLVYLATSTTIGIDQDIAGGVNRIPQLGLVILSSLGTLGLIALRGAGSIDLLVRHRPRQLRDSLIALLLAVVIMFATVAIITTYASDRLLVALAGTAGPAARPLDGLLTGLVAFLTVARVMGRGRWGIVSVAVVTSLLIVGVLAGDIGIAGLAVSVIAGWAVGLLVRYVLGTPTTRPSGVEVADSLERAGYSITVLRAQETLEFGRRYRAATRAGTELDVIVLDRDYEGAGLAASIYRGLRLRADTGEGGFSMRRALERRALLNYAAQAAGAAVPRLLLATEVGPDSAALVSGHVDGRSFADLLTAGETLDDLALDGAWQALKTLQDNRIAWRELTTNDLRLDAADRVWLSDGHSGTVAASDVLLRLDVAELLCTLSMATSSERALASGERVLGVDELTRALPVLQPVALSTTTRKKLREHKDLLAGLRDRLLELRPGAPIETVALERLSPRTLLTIVAGTVAAYVLLTQLGQVDIGALIAQASWQWIAVGFVASCLTYIGAALSLSGFVPERLNFVRSVMAQVAGDFATLVSPPTLGAVAINLRFLQKSGVHPALAAASVGVSQVAAFVVHLLLLVGFGIAAGTQQDFTFDPPRAAVIAVIAVAVALLVILPTPPVRRWLVERVGPILSQVGPRMLTVAQQPLKILEGVGGMVILNVAYCLCLVACVRAFGGDLNVAAIAVVYLAGATVGQAAPTPGGLGAVEAALTAGLTLAGLDASVAISAVLAFRLLTFWIPTVPGYLAFNHLTRVGAL